MDQSPFREMFAFKALDQIVVLGKEETVFLPTSCKDRSHVQLLLPQDLSQVLLKRLKQF